MKDEDIERLMVISRSRSEAASRSREKTLNRENRNHCTIAAPAERPAAVLFCHRNRDRPDHQDGG
jgi:hypothetical protein